MRAKIIRGPSRARPERSLRTEGTRVIRREQQHAVLESEARIAEARVHVEALLQTARDQAREQSEALLARARQEAAVLELAARNEAARVLSSARADLEQLGLAIARKLLGEALALDPALVASVVQQVLRGAVDARRVTLHVHPDDVPLLEARRSSLLANGELDALSVLPDADVARGGCIVQSERGLIDGRVETQLQTIADALFGKGLHIQALAMSDSLKDVLSRLEGVSPIQVKGRVTGLSGLVVRGTLPGARVGDHVRILRAELEPVGAEVVGFVAGEVLLMPLGDGTGIGPDSLLEIAPAEQRRLTILCGDGLLGRVVDGLGRPIDGGGPLSGCHPWEVLRAPPDPLARPRIRQPLVLGVRAIDGFLTVGQGQRVGLFAGSGVGKSTLLGQIARNTEAEVCVVCLVGERGREVREFVEEALAGGLERSVVVCATSDAPPLVRLKSAQVATAIAEFFRAKGCKVLLLMDSVTRYARALREVGLAAGEPPARRGYPPSVFAALPRLLERSGTAAEGSITAIYTVLVEGGDMEEPIADEVRGILDGHIVLDRALGQRGHFPAIDVLQSLSRVMPAIVDEVQLAAAREVREVLATYERQRDLIALGAYKQGSDSATDRAIAAMPRINGFLQQRPDENEPFEKTRRSLGELLS